MSDYCHQKVLRIPITLEELNMPESDDLRWDLEEKYSELFSYGTPRMFQIAPTEEFFLDYVLEYDYDYDSGDWGKTRELYVSEQDKYRSIFQQILPNVDMSKVRLIEFCWYNCSEAPDYYEPVKDKFYDEV